MIKLLLVSATQNSLSNLAAAFEKQADVNSQHEQTGAAALENAARQTYDLIIIDEKLDDMTGLALAEKMVKINPLVNCAVVSSLAPDAYHEASEGLGLLMQLPVNPGETWAEKLLNRLRAIINLTNVKAPV